MSVPMEPSDAGIIPVNMFSSRSRFTRLLRLPSVVGIDPFRPFPNNSLRTSQGAHGTVAKATGQEAPTQGSNLGCGT